MGRHNEENIPSLDRSPPRTIESTEPPLPGHSDEPPKGVFAMAVAILWGVLAFGFGFEAVVNFNDWLRPAGGTQDAIIAGIDLVSCFALGILAVILWKARDWLPQRVANSAIAVSTNPSVWVAVAFVILIVSALPQLRFQWEKGSTADEIALGILRKELQEAQGQRDRAIQERNAANQRLAALGAAMPNPLHSDAVKWRLTRDLAYLARDSDLRKECNIIIARYEQPYAETYAQDLKEILSAVDWKFTEMVAEGSLRPGLSILGVNQHPAQDCAQSLSQRLSSNVIWRGQPLPIILQWAMSNNTPSHLFACGGHCVQIGIGDDPDNQSAN